jgi:hypothetical protein
MADVIVLPCDTTLDLPVARVLDAAKEEGYQQVIVIGLDKDGILQLHSTRSDMARIFHDLHAVAQGIINGYFGRMGG